MVDLVRPLEHLWQWIDQTGGYPGKILVTGLVILIVLAGFTWYSNRR